MNDNFHIREQVIEKTTDTLGLFILDENIPFTEKLAYISHMKMLIEVAQFTIHYKNNPEKD